MLSVALGRFLEANHCTILTNKPVARLLVENGKCMGVECVDGTQYRAEKAVISTIHVKHIVNMAPHALWPEVGLSPPWKLPSWSTPKVFCL